MDQQLSALLTLLSALSPRAQQPHALSMVPNLNQIGAAVPSIRPNALTYLDTQTTQTTDGPAARRHTQRAPDLAWNLRNLPAATLSLMAAVLSCQAAKPAAPAACASPGSNHFSGSH